LISGHQSSDPLASDRDAERPKQKDDQQDRNNETGE
jgi:hypothetical protein